MKYFGVCIDKDLKWTFHINQINKKLVKAKAIICKIGHFVNKNLLQATYYGIYHSHFSYVCTV